MRHLILAAILVVSSAAWAGPDDAPRAAAASWMAIHQSGDYAKAWDQAGPLLKGKLTKQEWIDASERIALFNGKVLSRTIKSVEVVDRLPGFPEGKHAIVEFDTQFAANGTKVEVMVLGLEPDGVWRVSAYQ